LKPLALDQLMTGPPLKGYRVAHNDDAHLLVINGRIAPLSPTEYLLALALLQQRSRWERAEDQAPFCTSFAVLHRLTGIAHRRLLMRHMSNTSLKLGPLGLRIRCLREGYVLLAEHDVAKPETAGVR
jgi:hypothetical protein